MILDLVLIAVLGGALAWTSRVRRADWGPALSARWAEVKAWTREAWGSPLRVPVVLLMLVSTLAWTRLALREGVSAIIASPNAPEGVERRACFKSQERVRHVLSEEGLCPVGGGRFGWLEDGFGCPVHGVAPP